MLYAELRAFHAVAAAGSFTRAAAQLNLTQPTLSNQVKVLEERYGVALLDRRWRRVTTTDLGRQLYDMTRRLFALEGEAQELLASSGKQVRGRLTLGTDSPVSLVPMIQRFGERFPAVTVAVTVGNNETVLRALHARDVDIAVIANVAPDPRLYTLAIRHDPIIFFVDKSHPWRRRSAVPFTEIAGQRLIQRESGSVTRDLVDRLLTHHGISPAAVIEVQGREAAREVAANGLAVGVMSLADYVPDERLTPVRIAEAAVEMVEYLVCARDRLRQRLVASFLKANDGLPG